MSDKFGKITHDTLKSVGIDSHESGLARFIPGAGVSPRDFLTLPIEQPLQDCLKDGPGYRSTEELTYHILTSGGLLPDSILHRLITFAAREVLPVFEKHYPGDDRPRKAIEIKEKWLKGEVTGEELDKAGAAARNAEDTVGEVPAGDSDGYAARSAIRATTRAVIRNATWDAVENAVEATAADAAPDARADAWDAFYVKIFTRLCELIEGESETEAEG